jgi:Tol biopolymer transport system component
MDQLRDATCARRSSHATALAAALLLASSGGARSDGASGAEPRLVGEGTISTIDYEGSATITPDGRALYFVKRPPVPYSWTICVSAWSNGRWGTPEVASFSGRSDDTDPFVSPDGSRLFFASHRATPGASPKRDFDLWVVDKSGEGWGEPRPLPTPVNSDREEQHPSVDAAGNLYFASNRPGAAGVDVFRAAYVDGRYEPPAPLGAAVNTASTETHPAISPDGRTLVFVSNGRPDQPTVPGLPYTRPDLYVSTLGAEGWTAARRLALNSLAAELSPSFSSDGRRLLFVSERGFATEPRERPFTYGELMAGLRSIHNGLGNLYEVEVEALGITR